MNKHLARIGTTGSFILLLLVFVLALQSNTTIQTFESESIKALKQKFKTFNAKIPEDRVYLQTDKAFYKPGETIWFTAYVRDGETLKPSDNSDIIHVELITPKGTTEKHIKIVTKNGAANGDFDLGEHPGGIYKIKAYTEWQKNDDTTYRFEKDITVQSVVMPRLKMKIDFEKKAYGRGDEVVAKLELNTNANSPLANTNVKFTANLEGQELSNNTVSTDANGKVNLKFNLPKDLNTIDGTVNAMIEFEGSTESVSRSIPIVLNKIKLEFFPEGGDMVAGMNARVAFRASNEFDKPADVEGMIVDSKGAFVAHFNSYHFGMGTVEFTPKANETYKARIIKPTEIFDEYTLPEVLKVGYAMKLDEVKDGLQLSVNSWQNEQLMLVAQTRGKIYYSGAFKALQGENKLTINTKDFPIGVSQVTVFDSRGIERCERLAFVNKAKQLNITVSTDQQQYQPREKVTMNIKVTDEKGLPMPGNFSLAVVDDNLLSFADDKQGNILSKILLEPDLKEKVEEPNFYFDTKEPKADKALDLLMMTSGWRRYTWKQVINEEFILPKYQGEKAEITGVVYDGNTRKPLAGAVVKLQQDDHGPGTITDKNGNFSLRAIDLSSGGANLTFIAPYFRQQSQWVSSYGGGHNCYLYNASAPFTSDESPYKMNYQAVVRDEGGKPLTANQKVAVHFRVHAGSATGKVIYDETNTAVTNQFGLITLSIGDKNAPDKKNWAEGEKFLEVGIDPAGGTNYKNTGTTELISVPYALFAANGNGRIKAIAGPQVDVKADRQMQQHADAMSVQVQRTSELQSVSVVSYKKNKVKAQKKAKAGKVEADEEAAPMAMDDVAEMPADVADNVKAPDVIEQRIPDENLEGTNVGDIREAGFRKYDQKNETQPAILYRAKQFAQKKYLPADTNRNDFASTVYWNGNVETDRNGKAKVEFVTNDLISSFKTTIEGFGDDGSVGRSEYNFSTNLPFAMDAKIPTEMISGDKMMIPVFMKNTTESAINGKLQIALPKQLQLVSTQNEITLQPNTSKVVYLECVALNDIGAGKLEVKFSSEKYNDAISREINVVAKGFPANISLSGQDMEKEFAINP
ncbi:MAG: large extracellular alpha-helical protein, partial [Bacteroidota bacterium]|nr:large extracellular alpha-helical protein [Bacteroidota bacterium]